MFNSNIKRRKIVFLIVLVLFFFLFYFSFLDAPNNFPTGRIIYIQEGSTLRSAGDILEKERVISSSKFFSIISTIFFGGKVIAGGYFFEKDIPTLSVIFKVKRGNYGIIFPRLVFKEGITSKDMAKECALVFIDCKEGEFIELSKGKEGYLFPDTYFFPPNATAEDVIKAASKNFDKKIKPLEGEIEKFGESLSAVIIMASILEGEAKEDYDRKVIAGILWKRMKIGMPLQVDASFKYLNGKGSSELLKSDLKIDSPYNTYLYKGLPPTAINNPGIESIRAAINPIPTDYLFYLTDSKGVFHYAKNHDEHVLNKARHLK